MAGVELLQLRGQVGQFNPPVDKQTGARIEKEEEKGGGIQLCINLLHHEINLPPTFLSSDQYSQIWEIL